RSVARRTLDGAVGDLLGRVPLIADAADAQGATVERLQRAAAVPYARAATALTQSSEDGSIMRGEVLARWQEFVGTGELLKKLETGVGRLRDRVSAAFRGEPPPPERVTEAIESRLASMIIAQAHEASRQVDGAWRADPAGHALLGGDDLARASLDIAERAAAAVRHWQDDVIALIRAEGADKRQTARLAAFGVNGAALALMVAVFSATGGITGAEIGIAGASTVLAQKVLEAVFGEGAVRRLSEQARESLDARVDELMLAERGRFDVRLAALELDVALPDRVRQAAARAAAARDVDATAGQLPAGPGAAPRGIIEGSPAVAVKPRWRDRMRQWWQGDDQ
ncbi:MAG: transporter, partial [Actinomycetota bacterium]|nr:transporter [Actinomycetota bacterium]